jgi:hypothetical protein
MAGSRMTVPVRPCKDCAAEGVTGGRPTPYPGPRCATHHREWRKLKRAKAHERHVEKTYGLTAVEYADLYLAQGGRCFVCQRATGAAKRLAVDHDHRKGCGHPPDQGCRNCVRTLACGPCNQVVLGRYSVEALARAIMVLTDPPAQKILNPQGAQQQ